jgi:hypothetical protein
MRRRTLHGPSDNHIPEGHVSSYADAATCAYRPPPPRGAKRLVGNAVGVRAHPASKREVPQPLVLKPRHRRLTEPAEGSHRRTPRECPPQSTVNPPLLPHAPSRALTPRRLACYPQVRWHRPTTSGAANPSARAHSSRICSRGCGRADGNCGARRGFVERGCSRDCTGRWGAAGRSRRMGRFGGTAERRPSGACVRRLGVRSFLAVRRGRSGAIRTRAEWPEGWATGTAGVDTAGRAGTAGPRTPCGWRSAGSGSGFTVAHPVTLSRTRSKRVSDRRGTGPLCAIAGAGELVPRGRSPQGRTDPSDADAAHPVIPAPKGGASEADRSGRVRWRQGVSPPPPRAMVGGNGPGRRASAPAAGFFRRWLGQPW